MRATCVTRLIPAVVAIKNGVAAGAAKLSREFPKAMAAALAMAGSDLERTSLHRLLRAVQSDMALLDRSHTAHRSYLVFWARLKASMAAQFAPRLRRRRRVFHGRI